MVLAFAISTLVPTVWAIDGYYAHSSELDTTVIRLAQVEMSFEMSQNDMRLDILEDRIDRETKKPAGTRDIRKVDKLQKQYDKLDARQIFLINEQTVRERKK